MAVLRDPLAAIGGLPRRPLRAAFIGTYPPRQCGIAAFTHDLAAAAGEARTIADPAWGESASDPGVAVEVAAVDYEARTFPAEVHLRLDPERPADYLGVADRINRSEYDVVSLQHEFGIYGGPDGERVLSLLDQLEVPVISTLHTVLLHPSDNQRRIIRAIARASSRVVVLARTSARTLVEAYGVDQGRIRIIPHGVPDLPFVEPDIVKPVVGLAGRPTLLSFGLLGPAKGFDLAIRAMAEVVEQTPAACYVILGATHPELRRREGEAYRESLHALVRRLGLVDNVRFVDAFVDLPTLGRWLQAADVFVTPYPGAEQAVSGTLAYALGTGKALVSTPYAYARELLADGRGQLVPFGDSHALGRAISAFLVDRHLRDEARRRAYRLGRTMTWPRVGAAYRRLFAEVHESGEQRSGPPSRQPSLVTRSVPEGASSLA